ncbi:MAG TPA: hypothetical protein VJY47_02955 [Candidatus Dojkabacteria bacterium]|nr:hypothetical protein [Candidatus Dojkabacteria bacterium]
MRKIIEEWMLNEKNSPFTIKKLFDALKEKGIDTNKHAPYIMKILDELLEAGQVIDVYPGKRPTLFFSMFY